MQIVVNGERIDDFVIREERIRLRQQLAGVCENMEPPAAEKWISELAHHNLVSKVLLRQHAWSDPQPVSPDVLPQTDTVYINSLAGASAREMRRQMEERFRLERLLAKITKGVQRPTRKEIDFHYKTHRSRFNAPERVHALHIVKNVYEPQDREHALVVMREAQAELSAGADFAELADRISDCPGNGGDMGWFPQGTMVDEFDAVVFNLDPGETSSVFETRFGFHLVRVLERRAAGIQPLSEIRESLASMLHKEREHAAIAAFVDKLAANAEIQTEP